MPNYYERDESKVMISLNSGGFIHWQGLLPYLQNMFESKKKDKYNAIRIVSDTYGLTYSQAEAILKKDVKQLLIVDDNLCVTFHTLDKEDKANEADSKTKKH